jgi:hypothetical protein
VIPLPRIRVEKMAGRDNEPYAEGFVSIPALGKSGIVKFLIDTGNSTTCLGEPDVLRMGIDARSLPTPGIRHMGIGGKGNAREIKGLVMVCLMDEEHHLHEVELEKISVILNHREEERMGGKVRRIDYPYPSLLGRDYLSKLNCTLHFDFKSWGMFIEI